MYGPNSPKEEPDELLPEWHEPFPEPNTIPNGWNFGSLSTTPASAPTLDVEEVAED